MGKTYKILLADDSTLVKNNLKRLLATLENIEIYDSHDVDSTKKQLKKSDPQVLLLDLKMPGGSGFDVLEYIQQSSIDPIVIVLTNVATEENRKKGLRKGAHYFFDKAKEYKEAVRQVDELKKRSEKTRR